MIATDLDRYGCTVGGKRITYGSLRRYVCNDCGGAITHRFTWDDETETTVESVACAACGCLEMITERRYLEQISDGWEVLAGLPEQLRAQMKEMGQCQSKTETIDDLTGWG